VADTLNTLFETLYNLSDNLVTLSVLTFADHSVYRSQIKQAASHQRQ